VAGCRLCVLCCVLVFCVYSGVCVCLCGVCSCVCEVGYVFECVRFVYLCFVCVWCFSGGAGVFLICVVLFMCECAWFVFVWGVLCVRFFYLAGLFLFLVWGFGWRCFVWKFRVCVCVSLVFLCEVAEVYLCGLSVYMCVGA